MEQRESLASERAKQKGITNLVIISQCDTQKGIKNGYDEYGTMKEGVVVERAMEAVNRKEPEVSH